MIKKLFPLLLILLVCGTISAQTDKRVEDIQTNGPIKIGEFGGFVDQSTGLSEQLAMFVERLSKEPRSTRGAITYLSGYKFDGSCIDNRIIGDKSFGRSLQRSIPRNLRKRVVLIPGGISSRPQANFYLVHVGQRLPEKLETIFDPPCCCPVMDIHGTETVSPTVKRLNFTLTSTLESKRKSLHPVWTVSAGTIVSGQGTKSIIVDISNVKAGEVVAEVSITPSYIACNCPAIASFKTRINR